MHTLSRRCVLMKNPSFNPSLPNLRFQAKSANPALSSIASTSSRKTGPTIKSLAILLKGTASLIFASSRKMNNITMKCIKIMSFSPMFGVFGGGEGRVGKEAYRECLKSELVWISDSSVASSFQTVWISDNFFCLNPNSKKFKRDSEFGFQTLK